MNRLEESIDSNILEKLIQKNINEQLSDQYSIFYNDIEFLGYYEVETSKAILVKSHS